MEVLEVVLEVVVVVVLIKIQSYSRCVVFRQ